MTIQKSFVLVAILLWLSAVPLIAPLVKMTFREDHFPDAQKSSPVSVGPTVPGPFGSATKLPLVNGNVSTYATNSPVAAGATVQSSLGVNEFDLSLQETNASAMLNIHLQPGALMLGVTYQGRNLNFTYDETMGSLGVVIPSPKRSDKLQILYSLAGGLITRENRTTSIGPASSPPSSSANAFVMPLASTASIHGHVKTDFTNWNAPVAGIKIELHKNDWPFYTLLATQYTDSSGLYDFGNVNLSSTGSTLRFRIYVEGWSSGGTGFKERVVVTNAANFNFEVSGDTTHDYVAGDTYYLDIASNWMDPNVDFDDGLHAYYSIWQEFSYFRDNLGFVTSERGLTTAHIFATSTYSTGYDIYYESATYAYNHLITQHEFAHAIFYQAYGDHWADYYSGCTSYPSNHQDYHYWGEGHVTADPDTHGGACTNDAVNEGWAEFVPASIQNDGSWPVGDGSGGIAYYEQVPNGYGELNEFGFAGALWDLWKTPGQNPSTIFGDIWQVTKLDTPGRVETFLSAFISRYPSLRDAANTAFLNHFDIVSALSISLSSSSVIQGSSVIISGTLSPLPHVGKTVSAYIAPVGSSSWSFLGSATTGSDSTFTIAPTINVVPGSYDVRVSWTGDRYPSPPNPYAYSGHNGADSAGQPLTVTYTVTFQESGIPSGVTWGVTVGGTRHTSTTSSLSVSGLSGTVSYSYDSSVPGSGGSYVCSSGCSTSSVSGSGTVSATYTFQASTVTVTVYSIDLQYKGSDPASLTDIHGSIYNSYQSQASVTVYSFQIPVNRQITFSVSANPSGWSFANWWDDYGQSGQSNTSTFTISVGSSNHKVAAFFSVIPFAFSITTPGSQTTSQTGSATFSFTVTTTQGTPSSVSLGLSNPPSGTTLSWSPSQTITPTTSGTSVQLTITPSCSTTAQSYSTLQISGSGGGASAHSNSFTLTVTTSSSCPITMTVSYSLVGGGTGYSAPVFNYVVGGATMHYTLTTSQVGISVDAGSPWSVTNPLSGSSSSERWYSSQTLSGTATTTPQLFTFQHQFSLTVNGGNGVKYSVASQTGDNFWDAGTSLTVSSNGIYSRSGGSGMRVSSWNIDVGAITNAATIGTVTTSTITMSVAHVVNFNSVAQYQVTLDIGATNALSSVTSPTISGDNYWYDSGTSVTLTIKGIYGRSGSTGMRVTGYQINGGSNTPVLSTGTVAVLSALSITSTQAITTITVAQYLVTFTASPQVAGTATASTNPSIAGDTGWYDVGTAVSISAKANTGWQFTGWTGTGSGSCSGSCSGVTMNGPITEIANFLTSTSISLGVSTASISFGSSVVLSGLIAPNPGAVQVTVSFSGDSGSTWTSFIAIMSDGTGSYSTGWTPPYLGSYLLKASWSGNSQFAGSESSPVSLTVTGTATPSPTLLLSVPSTASQGQSATLSITVFNPTSSPLNANVTVQITGPGNYVIFDTILIRVAASSQSTTYYDWTAPNQAGTYNVTVGLLSAKPGGTDTGTIRYATATIQVT